MPAMEQDPSSPEVVEEVVKPGGLSFEVLKKLKVILILIYPCYPHHGAGGAGGCQDPGQAGHHPGPRARPAQPHRQGDREEAAGERGQVTPSQAHF